MEINMPSTPIFNPHRVRSALTILAMTMTHSLLPVKIKPALKVCNCSRV